MDRAMESRVEALFGVSQSQQFCLESELEVESVKFCQLQLWPRVTEYESSTDNDFGRMVMHHQKYRKIGRKGEKQCRNKVEVSFSDKISYDKLYLG